jgi:type II secretory pathway pseudopilin PulG
MHIPRYITQIQKSAGFTMIETLVAVTLLTMSVGAPLTLAAKSLQAAQYSRDQIVAFNLAQEAIEVVRAQRDKNLIKIAGGNTSLDWLTGIPTVESGDTGCPIGSWTIGSIACQPFIVQGSKPLDQAIVACTTIPCSVMLFDATNGWYNYTAGTPSRYTRTVIVRRRGPSTDLAFGDAIVRATVTWRSSIFAADRTVVLEDELYQWVPTEGNI